MDRAVVALPTLESLRAYVKQMLCDHDRLDPDQTPFTQAPVIKRGKTCGAFFQVSGPRLLKTYAVWAGEEHRILFYDTNGARFHEARLSEAPVPG